MLSSRAVLTLLLFLSLSSGTLIHAQRNNPGQWVGDLYLMQSFPLNGGSRFVIDLIGILVDEKDTIHKVIPNLPKVKDFYISDSHRHGANSIIWHPALPFTGAAAVCHNDAFYTNARAIGQLSLSSTDEPIRSRYKREDGSEFDRFFFAKRNDDDDQEWQYLGFYDVEPNTFLTPIPCDNDRFIFVIYDNHGQNNFNNRSNKTPFLRVSIPNNDKKELRLDSYIDHGQDEVLNYMSDRDLFYLIYCSNIILTDKYATLVNRTSGLYWVFSREKASLVRAGCIFNKLKANHLNPNGFDSAVLCAHPEKDGTVLISAQDENYLTEPAVDVMEEFNKLSRSGFFKSHDEAEKWMAQRLEEVDKGSPYVVWYRIYPESGKVERLTHPPEGGSLLRDGNNRSNDIWRPMPDGSVKMGPLGLESPKEGSETEKKIKHLSDTETGKLPSADTSPPKH